MTGSQDFVLLCLQITVMLACAITCGEVMRKFGQPMVLGEMIGGIVLGPTIFGAFFPSSYEWLFASSEHVTAVREAIIRVGMLFFFLSPGSERISPI